MITVLKICYGTRFTATCAPVKTKSEGKTFSDIETNKFVYALV